MFNPKKNRIFVIIVVIFIAIATILVYTPIFF